MITKVLVYVCYMKGVEVHADGNYARMEVLATIEAGFDVLALSLSGEGGACVGISFVKFPTL